MCALACASGKTIRDKSNTISNTSDTTSHMCLASLLVMNAISRLYLCETTVNVCAPISVDGCLRCHVIMLCGHLRFMS